MRRQLSKKEVKETVERISQKYGVSEIFQKKGNLEFIEDEKGKRLAIDGKEAFFFAGEDAYPLLRWVLENGFSKKVTVDMGAVKFVASGADIMRPGITKFDEGLEKNDVVIVVDEKNVKPIAVGILLFSGEEAESMRSGKVIKNIHYVGDKLWTA